MFKLTLIEWVAPVLVVPVIWIEDDPIGVVLLVLIQRVDPLANDESTNDGLVPKLAVAPGGSPLALSDTLSEKPPVP